jgi:hypothetical protein
MWDATSAKCPKKKFCWLQPPQSALGKNVLITLTQGHNFDFDFFNLGSDLIFNLGSIFFFFFLSLDDDLGSILDFRLRVEFLFS